MDDKTYRRLFCETPRQRRIRHNFPCLNHLMTKAESQQHEEAVADYERPNSMKEGSK